VRLPPARAPGVDIDVLPESTKRPSVQKSIVLDCDARGIDGVREKGLGGV
jgi:hypothetical protein